MNFKDNISTDEILPAGARVLPFRSNIHELSKFTFTQVDPLFYQVHVSEVFGDIETWTAESNESKDEEAMELYYWRQQLWTRIK